jgi:hypothetical protein
MAMARARGTRQGYQIATQQSGQVILLAWAELAYSWALTASN